MVKLGFVGAGRVGSSTAFSALHLVQPKEMALVDIATNLAEGEAMDLAAAAAGLGFHCRTTGGDNYAALAGSDLVVVTAGLARKPGMDRLDLLKKNVGIITDVTAKVVQHAPDAKVLMVTNPVDILTYVAWKKSGKPRNQVFGMGSWHDSMRLRGVLGDLGNTNPDAWILGEHGESMFAARSIATHLGKVNWDEVDKEIRGRAAKVIEKKGATFYAPGVATATMVASVVLNQKRILPTSVPLQGEFGIRDVSIGVPAVLGAGGVEAVVEYALSKEDQSKLQASGQKLRSALAEVGF